MRHAAELAKDPQPPGNRPPRSWLDEADPALDALELIRLAWKCRDADDFLSRAAAGPRACKATIHRRELRTLESV